MSDYTEPIFFEHQFFSGGFLFNYMYVLIMLLPLSDICTVLWYLLSTNFCFKHPLHNRRHSTENTIKYISHQQQAAYVIDYSFLIIPSQFYFTVKIRRKMLCLISL